MGGIPKPRRWGRVEDFGETQGPFEALSTGDSGRFAFSYSAQVFGFCPQERDVEVVTQSASPADGTAAKTPAPATVSMLGEQGDINAVD
jgi:hypothetical protein